MYSFQVSVLLALLRKNQLEEKMCQVKGKVHEKSCCSFLSKFVQITSPPPSPQFGQLVQLFLNAKNVDLSDIQSDSLLVLVLAS